MIPRLTIQGELDGEKYMTKVDNSDRVIKSFIKNEGLGLPPVVDIVDAQQRRMQLYGELILMASSIEEKKALKNTYEISRLIFINHEDVRQRSNMLLKENKCLKK